MKRKELKHWRLLLSLSLLLGIFLSSSTLNASSHREAPLISGDPLADNTDLYVFRSPEDPNTVTLIANYIPLQLPQGGPNWYTFGEGIRYEIHVDNNIDTAGDDIIYRATFNEVNEDPSTFFNIRLGAQNRKTTYTLERSVDGGSTFQTIVTNGIVPPPNIGPRSIESGVGLGADDYASVFNGAITDASTGERVFCGPVDDPFFVDLGGVFDLGDMPRQDGPPRDGLAGYNVHTIAIQVPISTLQKDGMSVSPNTDILDGDFVIGVWASASRPTMRTLQLDGSNPIDSGDWVQVSRIGMPLTNEAVIPIGSKDAWNFLTPYNEDPSHFEYFYNPELALYMDDDLFGGAVPAFAPLRIQKASLAGLLGPTFPGFDFTNGADGAHILKGSAAVAGTALDDAIFGTLLIPDAGKPRSIDLWPAFHTGVPNFPPYQLATGKMGNPLNPGKPFINNFLPNGGDMLRLNMATPVTARSSAAFSENGLIQAAVLGLTDPAYTSTTDVQFIPNMDGFPNGRRLEDDVTKIELQAVAGAVLAAVGLWYDDYDVTDPNASPVTQDLLDVLTYSTGVNSNELQFSSDFPYMAMPNRGTEVDVASPNYEMKSSLYVSNTANPKLDAFDNTIGMAGNYSRQLASGQADGNGIVVDNSTGLIYQLSRATSTVNVYQNSADLCGNATPVTSFTDAGITSGREIAIDESNQILYVASNTDKKIHVFDNPSILTGMVSADRVMDLNGEPWGISLNQANGALYVAKDKTDAYQVYVTPFDDSGTIMPDQEVAIQGATRVHGIHYSTNGNLYVTEIDEAAGPTAGTDGGIYVIANVEGVTGNSVVPNTVISGANTLLGNPVDVDFDIANDLIYVAEKTKGGSILAFRATDSGDITPAVALAHPSVPEDLFFNGSDMSLYVSNTAIAGIDIFDDGVAGLASPSRSVDSMSSDGNGVFVDHVNNHVYQLSRATSTIRIFDGADMLDGMTSPIAEFTDPGIVSGREIALDIANSILYVASNSDMKIHAYDSPTMLSGQVSASRVLDLNGEPWGISYDSKNDRLMVAKDKTDAFQVYDNVMTLNGSVSPTHEISIVGATRTHGITYSPEQDILAVTEIGVPSGTGSNADGGYYIIKDLEAVLASGSAMVTPTHTVAGASTQLGNPVDIALSLNGPSPFVYLAEKTDGGSVIGFPITSEGDVVPSVFVRYAVPEALFFMNKYDNVTP